MKGEQHIYNEIAGYNDSRELNWYYQTVLNEYNNYLRSCGDLIGLLRTSDQSLLELRPFLQFNPEYQARFDYLCLSYAPMGVAIDTLDGNSKCLLMIRLAPTGLFNARLVHALYQQRNQPLAIAVCGGKHLYDIQPQLKLMGYKLCQEIGDHLLLDTPDPLTIEQLNSILTLAIEPRPLSLNPLTYWQTLSPWQKTMLIGTVVISVGTGCVIYRYLFKR